jgi:regulatory protein
VPEERDRAVELAVRALARRDHSAQALRAKLERSGISEQAQEEVLTMLADEGYLDDARFARARAEHLAGRGYGDEWIMADLETQGVAPEVAGGAVGLLPPEDERATAEAESLGGGPKAVAALRRRGFSEESVERLAMRAVADQP